jgi:F0F1-type ATP synthase assembly protein I
MQSEENRLYRFAEGLLEACWLCAACVVPLIFNPRGSELAYQPFKFGILIILSSFGIAAWMVMIASCARPVSPDESRQRRVANNPLLWVLSALAVFNLFSALLSMDRSASVWGAPETFQGIATILASLAMIAMVGCNLRSIEQVNRLVATIVITGFVAALFAILQRTGFDPQRPELKGVRCHSTAGHSIYLAGYLLMTIPHTIWCLVVSKRDIKTHRLGMKVIVAVILLVQIVGFVCAESRGPTIGFCAMLLALGVFSAAHLRKRSWLVGIAAILAIGLIGVGMVSSGYLPKDVGANTPILKRFMKTKSVDSGVETYRAETWKHMPAMMLTARPLPLPSGDSDIFHQFRFWLGYGQETLQSVLPQYRAWKGTSQTENRFHNLVWEQFYSVGILGLSGFVALVLLTFHRGFRWLGWIKGSRDFVKFTTCITASTAVGAVAAAMIMSSGFIGMGAILGLVGGLVLYAASQPLRATCSDSRLNSGLIIAILAGIMGHLVDMAFAFPTAPTMVMFCLMVGMMYALTSVPRPSECLSIPTVESGRSATKSSHWCDSGILALILITLLFSMLHQYSYEPMNLGEILKRSLFNLTPDDGRASLLGLVPIDGLRAISSNLRCGW